MNEMVDRLTDILMSDGCGDSERCEKTARRLLVAMREPTPGMVEAGHKPLPAIFQFGQAPPKFLTDAYRAMIDAAMGEG